MLKTSLQDIMTEDIVTIKENATVGQAAHILLRFRINGILVVEKDNNRSLVGIITTTDLLRFLDNAMSASSGRREALETIGHLPLSGITRKNIIKLQKDAKIEKAIAIMHKRNVHTLPVYDGDNLVGVVGRHDLLNVVFSN
jgi:CBS domain-containing protein